MEKLIQRITPASRRAFLLGFGAAMVVLASTILAGLLYVRSSVHAQIARRDAEGIYATTALEQLNAAATYSGMLDDDQLALETTLLASRLRGVIGIRFYDSTGKFKDSFPANILPRDLQPWARQALAAQRPSAVLARDVPLDQVFIYLPQFATGQVGRAKILQIVIPLHKANGTSHIASAEFLLEGESIAAEYSKLDRQLTLIGGAALIVGGFLLAGMLWPVFHRVQKLNSELNTRNQMLQRANEELALAARTSALGAVSAHLMHGLKNPLASLSGYLSTMAPGGQGGSCEGNNGTSDQSEAIRAARRIQSMVQETLEVLADARGEPGYFISTSELLASVREKVHQKADRKGVELLIEGQASTELPSRIANLARLILTNLIENAIEATPAGRTVSVSAPQEGVATQRFQIKDQGPGFPRHLQQKLFLPCNSTKGGSGLGLAISHRLAEYLGAKLTLSSSEAGCVFTLDLPLGSFSIPGTSAHATEARVGRLHPTPGQHPSEMPEN